MAKRDSDLDRYIWKSGPDTGILIESVHKWDPTSTGKRPAVLIRRDDYSTVRVVINDLVTTTSSGHREHMSLRVGSHTLFCLHENDTMAEIIATEIANELSEIGVELTRRANLDRFMVAKVGSSAKLEEATENFVIPVTVGWAYQHVWRSEVESRKLKTIKLSVLLDGIDFQGMD